MDTDKRIWDWRTHILHDGPENPTYKHLLLTLSCYMDSAGGSCFPSITTLVEVTSLTKPTIVKYLRQAREDGWIKVKKHGFKGQKWSRNEYTATLPQAVKEFNRVSEKAVKEVNRDEGKAVKEFSEGGKTDSERRLTSLPTTSPSNSPEKSARAPDEGSRLFGVPVPAPLRKVEGFAAAYRDWWEYMRRAYTKFPNIFTVETQFQKLCELQTAGDDPVDVIRQSMEHQSKSFYPIREDFNNQRGEDAEFQAEGRPNAGAYTEYEG